AASQIKVTPRLPYSEKQIHPELGVRLKKVIQELQSQGWQPLIIEGYRSLKRQHDLQSKSHPSTSVTIGFHNTTDASGNPQAMAVDVVDKRYKDPKSKQPFFKEAQAFFRALQISADRNGLRTGLNWKKMPDGAHVQLFENSAIKLLKSNKKSVTM